MNYKRILTIQDISCFGKCSLTVALPILSACGHETCILPSAVLSTHTGGFSKPTFRDLTEDLPAIRQHWQKEQISFDAIYTGYLGSIQQIEYVSQFIRTMVRPDGITVVDPAMADHGVLYAGFDQAYAQAMGTLCRQADVVLPNLTEACMLTGCEYREIYDEAYISDVVAKLHSLGIPCVVLTGVSYRQGETGVLISSQKRMHYYRHPRISQSYHGTGDIFASAFVGSWMQGKSMEDAAAIAADFTRKSIENTVDDDSHWYGVKFETALPYLIHRLYD